MLCSLEIDSKLWGSLGWTEVGGKGLAVALACTSVDRGGRTQMAALTLVLICLDRASRQSSRGTSFLMWKSFRHRRNIWRLRRMETWNGCARLPSSLALLWARCPESPRRPVRGFLWMAETGTPAKLLLQAHSNPCSFPSPRCDSSHI